MANPFAAYALPTEQPPLTLPAINTGVESLRLAAGAIIRVCLHATVYYGGRALFEEKVQLKRHAGEPRRQEASRFVWSSAAEMAASLLWTPTKYLAAVTAPRFLLDYMLTGWSDRLAMIDFFRPGRYASYAMFAFVANATDEDWNLDFFAWQLPSVVLTLGKLIMRRRRLGAKQCRTKRVLGMLCLQVLLRAYVTTFSVMIPETGGQAVEAISVTLLESVVSSYLTRHTWPCELTETPRPAVASPRKEGKATFSAPISDPSKLD